MCNESGNIWLAYNGKISNFREPRKQFKLDDKYTFITSSGTEVLLHLYEEMSIGCFEHHSGGLYRRTHESLTEHDKLDNIYFMVVGLDTVLLEKGKEI